MKNRLLVGVSALALMTGVAACENGESDSNTVVVEDSEAHTAAPVNTTDEERMAIAANDLANAADNAADNTTE